MIVRARFSARAGPVALDLHRRRTSCTQERGCLRIPRGGHEVRLTSERLAPLSQRRSWTSPERLRLPARRVSKQDADRVLDVTVARCVQPSGDPTSWTGCLQQSTHLLSRNALPVGLPFVGLLADRNNFADGETCSPLAGSDVSSPAEASLEAKIQAIRDQEGELEVEAGAAEIVKGDPEHLRDSAAAPKPHFPGGGIGIIPGKT